MRVPVTGVCVRLILRLETLINCIFKNVFEIMSGSMIFRIHYYMYKNDLITMVPYHCDTNGNLDKTYITKTSINMSIRYKRRLSR